MWIQAGTASRADWFFAKCRELYGTQLEALCSDVTLADEDRQPFTMLRYDVLSGSLLTSYASGQQVSKLTQPATLVCAHAHWHCDLMHVEGWHITRQLTCTSTPDFMNI
jgi:hypothetical protein